MTPSRSSGPRQRGRRTGTGPRERLSALLARLPWWVALTVGVVAGVVGAFLTLAPFASLAVLVIAVVVGLVVTGLGELIDEPRSRQEKFATDPAFATDPETEPETAPQAALDATSKRERWGASATPPSAHRMLRGLLPLAAAVAILLWPGPTIQVIAAMVALTLVGTGLSDLAASRHLSGRTRLLEALGGATAIALGLVGLTWPDVTVLVVAIVFGVQVLRFGLRQVSGAVRTRRGDRTDHRVGGGEFDTSARRLGPARTAGTLAGAAVAVALVVVSVALERASPSPDAFYDAPRDLPATSGVLLRSEPYTNLVPTGAQGWRLLYTTTTVDADGRPASAVASAIVIVPDSAITTTATTTTTSTRTSTPSPVVAWAHGTTGAAPGCAPSVLDGGLETGAMFATDAVLARGWALVATDYVGLGTQGVHPYLIGPGQAPSVLDAVRAARTLDGVNLAPDTVVWGHSQGGHAALWTGILAPTYAPDVPLSGVLALAPASNLPGLVENLGQVTGGALFASYVISAYSQTYPDVAYNDYVRPGAQLLVREMAQRCLAEPGTLVSILTTLLLDQPIWQGDPDRGPLRARMLQNVPTGPIAAPLFIGQGAADRLVVPQAQSVYVAARCAAGQAVDYRTYAGLDHLPIVEAGSPAVADALAWTADRFAGRAAANTCH